MEAALLFIASSTIRSGDIFSSPYPSWKYLGNLPILTKLTLKIASGSSNRKRNGAGQKMIKRFFSMGLKCIETTFP